MGAGNVEDSGVLEGVRLGLCEGVKDFFLFVGCCACRGWDFFYLGFLLFPS